MNFLSSEKTIVIIFCFLFTMSATFLFWQNKRELDPAMEKAWWTLSFAQPENSESVDFIIENYTNESQFHYETSYEVTPGKVVSSGETITIVPGETKIITTSFTTSPDFRTTVTVTVGPEKKEIYR